MKKTHRNIYWLAVYFIFFLAGCTSVSIPESGPLSLKETVGPSFIEKWTSTPPLITTASVKHIPIPTKKARIADVGEKNTYRITVTPALKKAFDYYLVGNGEAALDALKNADQESSDPGYRWQVSYLRAQILIMMGLSADAEAELEETSRREIKYLGNNLNALALRGEARLWMEDLDGSLQDSAKVVQATGTFRFPTSYLLPPSNMPQLVAVTSAQLRAYINIAGAYIFKGDFKRALIWARETENRFNDVHYVNNHPLYGIGRDTFADSFYGRASNLIFLAMAEQAVTGNIEESDKLYNTASAFYTAIGYGAGQLMVETLKAWTFYRTGQWEAANEQAKKAIDLAFKKDLPDYIWKIEILRGKSLLTLGRKAEAEDAFRRAQASTEAVSGALATDRSKTRFGIGKEDITYYLANIDAEKRDYDRLFQDLERGRAMAFMDMLADRPLASGRHKDLVLEIRELDQKIRTQRLENASRFEPDEAGLRAEKRLFERRKRLIDVLKKVDPEIAAVLSVPTTTLKDAQKTLRRNEKIAYALPAKPHDNIRFLIIRSDSVDLDTIDLSGSTLQNQISDFSDNLEDEELDADRGIHLVSVKSGKSKSSHTEISTIQTLKRDLKIDSWGNADYLYVVPSGSLHFVPWGLLGTSYPISVLPTGGWLGRSPKTFAIRKQISIVGNPEFGGDLPQLAGAQAESIEIAKQFGVEPLIGRKATETNLRKDMKNGVAILHLATHGLFDQKDPLASAIFLSKDGKAAALTASDLYEHPLPARLVVLSACETGMGKTIAGEDMLGLLRSLYLGGTLSTMSSLWPIDDAGTKEFMTVFYRTLASSDIGIAWIKARDHVKKLGFPPSVYGAFILGGTMQK